MKYCGYIYLGRGRDYAVEQDNCYENPYQALRDACKKWYSNPDAHRANLLVVMGADDADKKYAFFNFDDRNSCMKFIEQKGKIIWSDIEEPYWNGNGKQMIN